MSGTQPVLDLSNTDSTVSFVFRGRDLTRAPSKFSFFAGGASQPLSLSKQTPIAARGFTTASSKISIPLSGSLTPLTYPLSLSSHPTPNHPLMFCPFAAPVGLGCLDLFFSSAALSVSTPLICCPFADSVGLDTFHL
ncbi:hypothetical protein TNCV_1220171 [Trichonephila clavipes]|nr:hypothetical protein TNCV_1220171 [Trichonephila clavipes]